MNTFFDSVHCLSEVHCRQCRAKFPGRRWRRSLMHTFEDVTKVYFQCPRGKKWTHKRANVRIRGGRVYIGGVECLPCSQKQKGPDNEKTD